MKVRNEAGFERMISKSALCIIQNMKVSNDISQFYTCARCPGAMWWFIFKGRAGAGWGDHSTQHPASWTAPQATHSIQPRDCLLQRPHYRYIDCSRRLTFTAIKAAFVSAWRFGPSAE